MCLVGGGGKKKGKKPPTMALDRHQHSRSLKRSLVRTFNLSSSTNERPRIMPRLWSDIFQLGYAASSASAVTHSDSSPMNLSKDEVGRMYQGSTVALSLRSMRFSNASGGPHRMTITLRLHDSMASIRPSLIGVVWHPSREINSS